jgi:hypothetical protein
MSLVSVMRDVGCQIASIFDPVVAAKTNPMKSIVPHLNSTQISK